jgi:hypothetical protein
MVNKYYLTQGYIFKCIEKENYDDYAYDKNFNSNGDFLYRICLIIGYKDDKIYFPFIGYEREKKDGITYINMEDDYIKKQYGDIYIKYNTLRDIYDFIKTLMYEFPKDIIIPENAIFKNGIIERNLGSISYNNNNIENLQYSSSNFLEKSLQKINILNELKHKLCEYVDKYVNIKIGYETLLTIHEEFTQEYFIKMIDKIINIDKYIPILDELEKEYNNNNLDSQLTKPLIGLALPWMNNNKLKQDYPILEKWL